MVQNWTAKDYEHLQTLNEMERDQAIKKISEKFAIPVASIVELLDGEKTKKNASLILKKGRANETIEKKNNHHKKIAEKKYLFIESDYDLLSQKIDEILKEIQRLGEEIGDSCSESETFHDNFDYEECGRQQKMWMNHSNQFRRIKENAEIVKKEVVRDYISIGDIVETTDENGKTDKKRIGSYLTFSKDDISYESPLAKLMMGKKLGDKIQGKIHGKLISFKITGINKL